MYVGLQLDLMLVVPDGTSARVQTSNSSSDYVLLFITNSAVVQLAEDLPSSHTCQFLDALKGPALVRELHVLSYFYCE